MEFMDVVHGVLDVAGFIPVVGAAADVANAAIYAAEGDWGNAVLSMVSAVPGVGDVAGAAGKVVKVAAKGASKAKKAGNAVSKTKKMTSFLAKVSGKAKTGAKKIQDQISRMIEMLKQKRNGKKNCSDDKCFTGDTLVCTKFGLRPIKEVQKGDDIYSRNEQTGAIDFRKIKEVFQTRAHTIYHIFLNEQAEVIKATAYHSFYVENRGWVTAIKLRENDILVTMEGTATVSQIAKVRYEESVEVFNFHVEEWNTYFVSSGLIFVHNDRVHPNKAYTVDPRMVPGDKEGLALNNGEYIKNPTARNITDDISDGCLIHENEVLDGEYMYVIDMDGNIVIGTRNNCNRMPHPTLIGGKDPKVQAAGMMKVEGGKICSINNSSGHFKPGNESLNNVDREFGKLPQNIFSKDYKIEPHKG